MKRLSMPIARMGVLISLLFFGVLVTSTMFISQFLKQRELNQNELLAASTKQTKIAHITALGRLEPQGEIIYLSPQSSNRRLEKMLVKVGDVVPAGQAIAVMSGLYEQQAEVSSATAKVNAARARLLKVASGETIGTIDAQRSRVAELQAQLAGDMNVQRTIISRRSVELKKAEQDYLRYKNLAEQGVVSKLDADEKRLQIDVIREQLKETYATIERIEKTGYQQIQNARGQLRNVSEVRPVDMSVANAELDESIALLQKAKINLESLYVRSPVAGQVLSVNTKVGEVVGNRGLVAIGQTQQMYAIAEVYESDIQYLKVGQSATIISEYGGFSGELKGVVDQIGLQIDKPGITNDDPSGKADVRVVTVNIKLNPTDSRRVKTLNKLQVRVSIQV